MKKLSIKETLAYCKEQCFGPEKKQIVIIPESYSTRKILNNIFNSFPGLAQMNSNGWIENKKDVKILFYNYTDNEISACCAIASERNMSLICLGDFRWKFSDIPEDAELIICYNERALTIGKLIAELRKKENPENVIPVFCEDERVTFAQNRTNGGLYSCSEFKSVLLEDAWTGPAISLESYIEYLSSNFPEDTIVECNFGFPYEVSLVFENNVALIECSSYDDLNWWKV